MTDLQRVKRTGQLLRLDAWCQRLVDRARQSPEREHLKAFAIALAIVAYLVWALGGGGGGGDVR